MASSSFCTSSAESFRGIALTFLDLVLDAGTGWFVIRLNDECDTRFAHFQISSTAVKTYLEAQAVGVTMMNLNQGILSSIQIPLPDLETQRAIVADIEAEQALVAANIELIRRMEVKVKAAIDRVWDAS